ncbi:MAG: hypothetical protein JWO30_1415 [Fibrobacteres bacterium]|nr:hypothetical protein [Fibrobacterota bacterium]
MPEIELTEKTLFSAPFSLTTGQSFLFKLERFKAFCLEVGDFHFNHDSAVFLPEFKPEEQKDQKAGEVRFRGLAALRACYIQAETHADESLLIAGHTDTSGAADYNVKLSQQRADSVLHILVGNRAEWVRISDHKHKVEDYKLILKWTAKVQGWASDPGAVNNTDDAATKAALREFQKSYNLDFGKSIAVDGAIGPETWGAIFDVYMEALGNLLDTDRNGLAPHRDALRFITTGPTSVGCGENFPIEAADKDNFRSKTNRRVELLFFLPEQSPVLDCHKGAGACIPSECPVYKKKEFKFEPVPIVPKPGEDVSPEISARSAPASAPAGSPPSSAPGTPPAGTPSSGSGSAPAPAPAPASGSPTPASTTPAPAPGVTPPSPPPPVTPNPTLTATTRTILVKKPYTKTARKQFTLKTSAPFDGTGLLTISKPGIAFFTVATAGVALTFNGTDNKFTGAQLTAGVNLFAEGTAPSTAVDDIDLTLTLSGGSFKVGPPAVVKLTAVEVFLDLCQSRNSASTDPTTLGLPGFSPNKVDDGRFLHIQDPGGFQGRAMIIVQKARPAAFAGKLVLKRNDAKLKVFPNERPTAGETAVADPDEIDNASIPSGGLKLFVEGATVSGALRDTGFTLGVKDVDPEGDKVSLTVIRLKNFKADVPSTPAQTSRSGNSPVNRHKLDKATGAAPVAADFDVDFTANPPIVLIENSLLAADPLKLSVEVEPAGVPVLWSVQRDTRPAPNGDDATTIALSPKPLPTLKATSAGALSATVVADAVGSFHLRPFVDCNGNGTFEDGIGFEPFIIMNLVLIRIKGASNRSLARSSQIRVTPAVPTSATGCGVSTGAFVNGTTSAVHNDASVTVTGGGGDGKRGLDSLFGGWVNNELAVATSPTAPLGEDVVSEYTDTTVAPPVVHRRISVWVSAAAGSTFAPGGAAPALVSGPVLDTTNFANPGTGGNLCVGTEGRVGPPLPITKTALAVGQTWQIEMWDSPGDNCPSAHGFLPGTLTAYRFNLDFRSDLCFWTNIAKTAAPTADDPASRLYSRVMTNTWQIRLGFTFNPATGASTPAPAGAVTMAKDAGTGLAQPVQGSGLETRFPISLNMLATDARS